MNHETLHYFFHDRILAGIEYVKNKSFALAYIPLNLAVWLGCLRTRRGELAISNESPYLYTPPAPVDIVDIVDIVSNKNPPTYRYLHSDFKREL